MEKIDKNKLIFAIAIVSGCLIIGGFLYAIQINKQNSIERQQQTELANKLELEQTKLEQNNVKQEQVNTQQTQLLQEANDLKKSEIARKKTLDEKRVACININQTFTNYRKQNDINFNNMCLTETYVSNLDGLTYRLYTDSECTSLNLSHNEDTLKFYQDGVNNCNIAYPNN